MTSAHSFLFLFVSLPDVIFGLCLPASSSTCSITSLSLSLNF
ncbi:hypothetical protein AMTRI_Chr05g59580 [Amborella trichopoda]